MKQMLILSLPFLFINLAHCASRVSGKPITENERTKQDSWKGYWFLSHTSGDIDWKLSKVPNPHRKEWIPVMQTTILDDQTISNTHEIKLAYSLLFRQRDSSEPYRDLVPLVPTMHLGIMFVAEEDILTYQIEPSDHGALYITARSNPRGRHNAQVPPEGGIVYKLYPHEFTVDPKHIKGTPFYFPIIRMREEASPMMYAVKSDYTFDSGLSLAVDLSRRENGACEPPYILKPAEGVFIQGTRFGTIKLFGFPNAQNIHPFYIYDTCVNGGAAIIGVNSGMPAPYPPHNALTGLPVRLAETSFPNVILHEDLSVWAKMKFPQQLQWEVEHKARNGYTSEIINEKSPFGLWSLMLDYSGQPSFEMLEKSNQEWIPILQIVKMTTGSYLQVDPLFREPLKGEQADLGAVPLLPTVTCGLYIVRRNMVASIRVNEMEELLITLTGGKRIKFWRQNLWIAEDSHKVLQRLLPKVWLSYKPSRPPILSLEVLRYCAVSPFTEYIKRKVDSLEWYIKKMKSEELREPRPRNVAVSLPVESYSSTKFLYENYHKVWITDDGSEAAYIPHVETPAHAALRYGYLALDNRAKWETVPWPRERTADSWLESGAAPRTNARGARSNAKQSSSSSKSRRRFLCGLM